MKWIILMLGVFTNTAASILIKIAMTSKDNPIRVDNPLTIFSNLPLITGLTLYGMTFVLYALALVHFPLNIAHPILTSGSVALVGFLSFVIFGESLTMINVLGIVLIVFGVFSLAIG